jgi:hypothetical protein
VTAGSRFHAAETSPNHVRNGCASSSLVTAAQTGKVGYMAMWRIRINLADDPRSRERLNEVLASQQVQDIRLVPRKGAEAELSGDVVLELPRDDTLGEMLTALHMISPQVFVSRADVPASPADDTEQAPEVRESALLSPG